MYTKVIDTATWLREQLINPALQCPALLHNQEKSSPDQQSKAPFQMPKIAIILGTGLGQLAQEIKVVQEFPYNAIPHFPVSTVEGHDGKMIFGYLGGKSVLAMKGRFHYYEGYSMQEVTFPIRVMYELGITTLLVSNAAGGANKDFRVGDLMVITDHINLFPEHPLRGKNIPTGPRFPDMHEAYEFRILRENVPVYTVHREIGVGRADSDVQAGSRALRVFGKPILDEFLKRPSPVAAAAVRDRVAEEKDIRLPRVTLVEDLREFRLQPGGIALVVHRTGEHIPGHTGRGIEGSVRDGIPGKQSFLFDRAIRRGRLTVRSGTPGRAGSAFRRRRLAGLAAGDEQRTRKKDRESKRNELFHNRLILSFKNNPKRRGHSPPAERNSLPTLKPISS